MGTDTGLFFIAAATCICFFGVLQIHTIEQSTSEFHAVVREKFQFLEQNIQQLEEVFLTVPHVQGVQSPPVLCSWGTETTIQGQSSTDQPEYNVFTSDRRAWVDAGNRVHFRVVLNVDTSWTVEDPNAFEDFGTMVFEVDASRGSVVTFVGGQVEPQPGVFVEDQIKYQQFSISGEYYPTYMVGEMKGGGPLQTSDAAFDLVVVNRRLVHNDTTNAIWKGNSDTDSSQWITVVEQGMHCVSSRGGWATTTPTVTMQWLVTEGLIEGGDTQRPRV